MEAFSNRHAGLVNAHAYLAALLTSCNSIHCSFHHRLYIRNHLPVYTRTGRLGFQFATTDWVSCPFSELPPHPNNKDARQQHIGFDDKAIWLGKLLNGIELCRTSYCLLQDAYRSVVRTRQQKLRGFRT
jgi:hypothetical protein